jgi:hypothetical protein
MIFRSKSGILIQININDYITDEDYYIEVMKLKAM